MRNAKLSALPMARVPLAIQPTAGNSDPASRVAAAQKSYLNKLNALNTPLNRKPSLPPTGPFGASGRRHAAAFERVLHLRRGSQPSTGHDANLIAVTSADGD